MAANPALREELAACAELGIPHSQFLGGDGRWSDLDRAKVLGFRRYKASLCQNCGTSKEQWGRDPDAFTYQLVHCEGCKRIEDGRQALEDEKGPQAKGYYVRLIPPSQREDVA